VNAQVRGLPDIDYFCDTSSETRERLAAVGRRLQALFAQGLDRHVKVRAGI
jgi:hypothetical protein